MQVESYTFIDRNHMRSFEVGIVGLVTGIPIGELRTYLKNRMEPPILVLANYTRIRI